MMLAMYYAALERKYEANAHICLDRKCIFKMMLKQYSSIEQRWGRSSVWLERLPVTQEAASSSLVAPAIFGRLSRRPFSFLGQK